jgi:Zn-dependent M28 family amino/carboxypeptidase
VAALVDCVSEERWVADMEAIAEPRPPGSRQWQTVQDLCATRFDELGFQVERQDYGSGVNVIGIKAGSGTAGPRVIVSAHYDHLVNCPGADDDASGVAGILEAAYVLTAANLAGTLVVACWDEEERGLLGSRAYAMRARSRGETITAAFSLEMIAYRSALPGSQTLPQGFEQLFPDQAATLAANGNRGDFIAVIADDAAHAVEQSFVSQAVRVNLPTLVVEVPSSLRSSAMLADLRRSDHASFWSADYPAIMLTDTAEFRNPHYHCEGGPDVPSDLDPVFATLVVRATVGAVASVLELR